MRKETVNLIIITDYGAVIVPKKVELAYERFFFRKRGKKKAYAAAYAALEKDINSLARYAWFTGRTGVKW